MIQLTQLLTEVLVKNKKTGNVYNVVKMNPQTQEKPTEADIQTAKAKNGGKIPTEKPAPTANIVNKPKDPTATSQNLQKLAQLKQQVAANNDEPNKSNVPQKMTNRDTQIEKLYNKKEAADNEWDYQYRQYSQAIRNNDNPAARKKMENEWDKIDIELQQKSNAIQKQINNLEPSTISFGKKTQKAVSDWFDTNKIPYELKAGSNSNTPELQFDSKDLPKDKVKELVQLAKLVQKKEKIGIDGDLDSTLYVKENMIKLRDLLEAYNPAEAFNKKVSKMTDRNQHSEAAVELAIYMDDRDAVRKLTQIKKDHDKRGSLTTSDQRERDSLVDKLLKKAKKELSDKDYKLINSSF